MTGIRCGMGLGHLLVACGLVACTTVPAQSPSAQLKGTQWLDATASVSQPLTLVFGTEGGVNGFSGCNRYFGSVDWTDSQPVLGPLASSRMLCQSSQMDVENRFLTALRFARSWRMAHNRLQLLDGQGTVLWQLERKPD